MSRIYDALQRTGGRMADLTHVGIDGAPRHRSSSANSERELDPLQNPVLVPVAAGEDVRLAAELARVPVEQADIQPSSRLVVHGEADGPGADRFRFLRMRLREYWALGKVRTLLITSPQPGDGKSTVALNLATALAEGGKRSVLLIEADQHRPALAKALGIPPGLGLAECLGEHLDPLQLIRRVEPLHWYLLRAGETQQNRTELLESDALPSMMKTFRRLFDWILIDTPPVIPLADTLVLARHVDTSLLVVRADITPREAVEESLTLLGPKRVLGIVLNGAESLNRVYSKYYRHYKPKTAAETAADQTETGL